MDLLFPDIEYSHESRETLQKIQQFPTIITVYTNKLISELFPSDPEINRIIEKSKSKLFDSLISHFEKEKSIEMNEHISYVFKERLVELINQHGSNWNDMLDCIQVKLPTSYVPSDKSIEEIEQDIEKTRSDLAHAIKKEHVLNHVFDTEKHDCSGIYNAQIALYSKIKLLESHLHILQDYHTSKSISEETVSLLSKENLSRLEKRRDRRRRYRKNKKEQNDLSK